MLTAVCNALITCFEVCVTPSTHSDTLKCRAWISGGSERAFEKCFSWSERVVQLYQEWFQFFPAETQEELVTITLQICSIYLPRYRVLKLTFSILSLRNLKAENLCVCVFVCMHACK